MSTATTEPSDGGRPDVDSDRQPSLRRRLALYASLLLLPGVQLAGGESISVGGFLLGALVLGWLTAILELTSVGATLRERTVGLEAGQRTLRTAIGLAALLVAAFVATLGGIVLTALLDVSVPIGSTLVAIAFYPLFAPGALLGGVLTAIAVDLYAWRERDGSV